MSGRAPDWVLNMTQAPQLGATPSVWRQHAALRGEQLLQYIFRVMIQNETTIRRVVLTRNQAQLQSSAIRDNEQVDEMTRNLATLANAVYGKAVVSNALKTPDDVFATTRMAR